MEFSYVTFYIHYTLSTLPQNPVHHTFHGLVEDNKDVLKNLDFIRLLKGQSKHRRPHNQAQRIGFPDKDTIQLHCTLKQDAELNTDRSLRATLCICVSFGIAIK